MKRWAIGLATVSLLGASRIEAKLSFSEGAAIRSLSQTANLDFSLRPLRLDLNEAVKARDAEAVASFLANRNTDVNAKDKDGCTPLMNAVMSQDERVVRMLAADARVNVNLKGCGQATAVMLSVNGGPIGILQALLGRSELRLDLKDDQGHTALSWAAIADNAAAIHALRSSGNRTLTDADRQSALGLANRFGHRSAASALT